MNKLVDFSRAKTAGETEERMAGVCTFLSLAKASCRANKVGSIRCCRDAMSHPSRQRE